MPEKASLLRRGSGRVEGVGWWWSDLTVIDILDAGVEDVVDVLHLLAQ